ncbi:MAG: hypothetical protein HETSPECPRED_003619 [Heterodermia speciosa]|uniref:Uncharacterized protein n=1 Tax=Heterodermia speciosa TaxID=116794 RepID=A0A8H3F4N6_9LECA|nr:MAG: hypothetical protein HETSPECPRED_003619 [Heterodermia speciosa]
MSSVSSPRGSTHGFLNNEPVSFLQSAKDHKRFKLRAITIGSVAVGLVLNFTTLMVAIAARNSRGPALITGFAFIPVRRNSVFRIELSILNTVYYLALSLHALAPRRSIFTQALGTTLLSSSVHLIIVHRDVLENIKKLFGSSHQGGNGCSHCTHCRSQWAAQTRKPATGAGYSLLSPQEQYDEDTEANPRSVSVEETRQTENTPLTAAAGDGAS